MLLPLIIPSSLGSEELPEIYFGDSSMSHCDALKLESVGVESARGKAVHLIESWGYEQPAKTIIINDVPIILERTKNGSCSEISDEITFSFEIENCRDPEFLLLFTKYTIIRRTTTRAGLKVSIGKRSCPRSIRLSDGNLLIDKMSVNTELVGWIRNRRRCKLQIDVELIGNAATEVTPVGDTIDEKRAELCSQLYSIVIPIIVIQ